MAQDNNDGLNIPTESKIKKAGFNNFMSGLFGFKRRKGAPDKIDFTKVDLGSESRVGQAFLNQFNTTSGKRSETVDKLFNSWLSDTTDKITEISQRRDRIDQLTYAKLNDPYINRAVQLYADEACQLDVQDTILNIETPDPRMTRDMYKLLSQWGVTQTRIRSTIENLATYGDAFWANKVSENGVERIIPLQQLQVTDRIEFNPVQALEKKKRREGSFASFAGNNYLIQQMLHSMEDTGDFADIFDTKLFGFAISNDLVVPPWAITHFRVGNDLGQFWPFGTSPILGTLAPFKQISSTIALQSLARIMSFPVTLYKVKTSDTMDEGRQFSVVDRVREAYDNIGVTPGAGSSEVYTVNTKIWIPDGLLDVEVKDSKVDIGFTDDIKLYQDRVAVAAGIPKSFYSDEWFGVNASGKSLMQQYKPFGRMVYSIQTAFLESLADLFRIHFAITGQYDFRIPFTLSMKFPAEEVSSDKSDARKNSIEVANDVVSLIKSAIGAGEDEPLPPDIARSILAKYSFLDPNDIMKWTRDAVFRPLNLGDEEEDEGGGGSFHPSAPRGSSLGGGSGIGSGLGGSDMPKPSAPETPPPAPEMEEVTESVHMREKQLCENYRKVENQVYFEALESVAVNSFNRDGRHIVVSNRADDSLDLMLETLSKESTKGQESRLRESFAYGESYSEPVATVPIDESDVFSDELD